tara:strand:- start:727 stop:1113 length:387 start_codon:yes stop_codon:yes gene_type:complete
MAERMERLKTLARALKRDVIAVWIAARSARTPWIARLLAVGVAAYALSPIDLVPDFIPVIGYLDDLILVPMGIALVVRLIPSQLMTEFREEASLRSDRPSSRVAAALVVLVWIAVLVLLGDWLFRKLG